MMRHTVTLALIFAFTLCASRYVGAQDISFAGSDIVLLAKTIADNTKETYQLSPSYVIPYGDNGTAIVTAPMAFEILARTVTLWSTTNVYPDRVDGIAFTLKAPPADQDIEPSPDRRIVIPTVAKDIIDRAPDWIKLAQAQQNVLPTRFTFETGYKLTAAQYLVAMAMLIDESIKEQKIPMTLAVPAVRSPKNWEDKQHPLSIFPHQQTEAMNLRVILNGVEVPKGNAPLPAALSQSFCGSIRIGIASTGAAKITIALDETTLHTFTPAEMTGDYTFDSTQYTDDMHILSVTATDTAGNNYPIIISMRIENGRISGFTPAKLGEPAEPLPFIED